MANEVKVALGVQDNLTTQLRRIEGEVSKFHNGISRQLTKYAAGVVSGAAILGSVGAIKSFANESIQAFKEAEVADRKLQAVLKSTGMQAGITFGELKKMASGLQDVTTVDDEAIQGAEHLLLTYTKIGKNVFPEALEATLNLSEAMGGDLNSAAKQLGKALNDPIKGISSLHRLGVSFSKTQEEQIKKFVEGGNVAQAQAVMLGELEKKYGGLARALADTDTGKLKQMENQLGNIKEEIGKEIIPVQVEWNRLMLAGARAASGVVGYFAKAAKIAGQINDGKSLEWIRTQRTIEDAQGMETDDAIIYLAKQRDLLKPQKTALEKQVADQELVAKFYKGKYDAKPNKKTNSTDYDLIASTRETTKLNDLKRQLEEVTGLYNDLEAARKSFASTKPTGTTPGGGDGETDKKQYLYKNDQLLKNIESYKAPSYDVQIPQYMIDSYNLQEQAAKDHNDALLRIQTEYTDGRRSLMVNQFDLDRDITKARYKELYELAAEHHQDTTALKQQEADIIARINEQEKQSQLSFVSSQLGALANIAQGNRKFISLYKTMALAQVGMDTIQSAVRVSKQAYEQFGKINVYAGIAAAVSAGGIVTASGMAQSAKIANMKYASGVNFVPKSDYYTVGENGPETRWLNRGDSITNHRETKYNTTTSNHMTANFYGVSGNQLAQYEAEIRDGGLDGFVRTFMDRAARVS